MARFSIWTLNMAVFGSPKACMDHRIREVPDIRRLILGILGVIQERIQECKTRSKFVLYGVRSNPRPSYLQASDSLNMLPTLAPRSRFDYPFWL